MKIEMANLALHVSDTIESATDSRAPAPAAQPTPSATLYAATASNNISGELLALLKAMDTRLQKIESGHQNRK